MSVAYAVTGANGHLGRQLTQCLLDRDQSVIAIVRSQEAAAAVLAHPRVQTRYAALMDEGALSSALAGARGVFHAAAPTQMWARRPMEEIVRPIYEGTQNVLRVCARQNIRRVLHTSTAATVGLWMAKPCDETAWNMRTRHPQFLAKRRVEQELTPWATQRGIEFIAVCPPSVIGPGAVRDTPSLEPYRQLAAGKVPFLPPMCFHLLDVRDHAEAQVRLMLKPNLRHSRYLVAGHAVDLRRVVQEVAALFPQLRLPTRTLPKGFFYPLSAVDYLASFWTGQRQLPKRVVDECIGCRQQLDGRRLVDEISLSFRSLQDTLRDTMQSFMHT